jgi:hypothetical protein
MPSWTSDGLLVTTTTTEALEEDPRIYPLGHTAVSLLLLWTMQSNTDPQQDPRGAVDTLVVLAPLLKADCPFKDL